MGHERFHRGKGQPLLDGALHAHKAHPELVLEEFAHGADPPVAEMVDIISRSAGILQLEELAHDLDDILPPEDGRVQGDVDAEAMKDLEPADPGKIIPLGTEEHVLYQRLGKLDGGRVAGPQFTVYLDEGVFLRDDLVDIEGVASEGLTLRLL
jgi:hypothetical protein